MKCPKCGSELRKGLSFCPKCGEVVSTTGTTAQKNNTIGNDVSKKKTPPWLIVLAVLFFPFSLTYLLIKTKKLKTPVKIVLIVLLWVFVIVVGNSESEDTTNTDVGNVNNSTDMAMTEDNSDTSEKVENTAAPSVTNVPTEVPEEDVYHVIDTFIEKYNAVATTKMTDAIEINIDKSSNYYRTEYRTLNNAVAKLCNVGGATIEIVSTDEWLTGYNIRVYLTTDSVDLADEVFSAIVKIVYPDITDEVLQTGKDDLRRDTSSVLDDIVFYYHSHSGEMFMNNVMYAE